MARPTTYNPEFCDRVVEFGRQGKSLMWMAAEFGVHRDTMYEWMAVHAEFSDAIKRARALAQQWWEDAGQDALSQPGFNGAMWGKNMAARFAEDWREKNETALTGANGGPVEVKEIRRVIIDPQHPNT